MRGLSVVASTIDKTKHKSNNTRMNNSSTRLAFNKTPPRQHWMTQDTQLSPIPTILCIDVFSVFATSHAAQYIKFTTVER